MWRVLVLVMITGCAFQPAGGASVDGGGDDGPDPGPDAPASCTSAAVWLDTCALPPSGPALTLEAAGTYLYDTETGELRDPDDARVPNTSIAVTTPTGSVRVVVVDAFTLSEPATLRAIGSIPLAIVTIDELVIAGTLDVGRGGAGARTAQACGDNAGQPGGPNSGGGAGGGGGGLGATGASGGPGNSDGSSQPEPGKGGVALGPPAGPVGGCPGGAGGEGEDPGGAGGRGGGAVYLISSTVVEIAGTVDAGGEAGRGGTEDGGGNADAGGGGGGSGGLVAVDAPRLVASGVVVANGGGGGEGSGNGQAGNPGQPGQRSTAAALGGTGGSVSGSAGSAGGALDVPTGADASPAEPGGGGGGGGSVGFIIFRSPMIGLGTVISPAPT